MKILFSTDQIYLHGGIEKTMAVKANYFADVLGHEVFILTTEQKGNAPCYQLSAKIKIVDIEVGYERTKSYFHPANLSKIPRHFGASKKAIREIGPDVIISCNYAFDFYWLPFIFGKTPKLKEYHGSRVFEHRLRKKQGFPKNLKFKINDFIESKFTRLILLNPDEKPFYGSHNLEVIPNPIDIPNTKAALVANRAIAAGRIAPIKGFDTLIDAWKKIASQVPDWTLDIYGQGESDYIGKLQTQIDSLQLTDRIFIRPAVLDLRREMLTSSLYLMTSHTECYPMVLLEAAAIGLPVVSFDCPTGPRHIVVDGVSGLLAGDQNIDGFCEKILSLAKDHVQLRQLGDGAKSTAMRFSTEVVMQQWTALFEKLNIQG
jgi:glycosyltransferase involved in cell wall biosynthesis